MTSYAILLVEWLQKSFIINLLKMLGITENAHQDWLARSTTGIKRKYFPDRDIVVLEC